MFIDELKEVEASNIFTRFFAFAASPIIPSSLISKGISPVALSEIFAKLSNALINFSSGKEFM
ncbi:hypothetical protein D3C85_1576610 [compost metagenome]